MFHETESSINSLAVQFYQSFVKTCFKAGHHKSESDSLTLRQCDAFTDDVPPFGLFIEQLEIFLVTTFDFGVSVIFYTLIRNS